MIDWFRKDLVPIWQLLIVAAILSGAYDLLSRLVDAVSCN